MSVNTSPNQANQTVRLLVADDHELVRSGISTLLTGSEFELIGEAEDGDGAFDAVEYYKPDIVLLDIRMPRNDGLATLERIKEKWPELPVLMLSTYDNPTYIARAHALGASGYVLKGCSRQDLLRALRDVAAGREAWTMKEMRRVMNPMPAEQSTDMECSLTHREIQVLRQLALGLSNKEIARALHISVETVKEHVHHILEKLGVAGRTQAAVWAVRHGVI